LRACQDTLRRTIIASFVPHISQAIALSHCPVRAASPPDKIRFIRIQKTPIQTRNNIRFHRKNFALSQRPSVHNLPGAKLRKFSYADELSRLLDSFVPAQDTLKIFWKFFPRNWHGGISVAHCPP
jgi:hypothetical protein